jgi:hypothetical protein
VPDPNRTCPLCGTCFYLRPAKFLPVNYCSRTCKGVASRGISVAPSSQFKPGVRAGNWQPVGTVTIRQRKNRHDQPRAWVKVAEPNVWQLRAVVVWEAANGRVPRGSVVHHVNHDSLDDRIENLQSLTRGDHFVHHRPEFEAKRAARQKEGGWSRRGSVKE